MFVSYTMLQNAAKRCVDSPGIQHIQLPGAAVTLKGTNEQPILVFICLRQSNKYKNKK